MPMITLPVFILCYIIFWPMWKKLILLLLIGQFLDKQMIMYMIVFVLVLTLFCAIYLEFLVLPFMSCSSMSA
ncbi:unnamed protein product [Heterobilharzia americana]|nr:unnamed protein product [Heterobilharzia americana]